MNKNLKILYYGACGPTNIGNAFIDLGSLYIIKKAAPSADVFFASELPRWLFRNNGKSMDKSLDLAEIMDVDFVVVSGMMLCDDFIKVEGPIIQKLCLRGAKLVLSGAGSALYTKSEIDNFKKFTQSVKIAGFISRDEESYNNFKDICQLSHNGIDCAFFIPDFQKPAPLLLKKYIVLNFDALKEPVIKIPKGFEIIRTHHNTSDFININDNIVSKIWAKIMPRKSNYLKYKQTLISDIPEDYLNIYANARAVYSDRVHACIATLAYGKPAKLYSSTPRKSVFAKVGASAISKKLVKADMKKLNQEKKVQIAFLKKIFRKNEK